MHTSAANYRHFALCHAALVPAAFERGRITAETGRVTNRSEYSKVSMPEARCHITQISFNEMEWPEYYEDEVII